MWVSEYVFFVRKEDKQADFNGYQGVLRDNLTIGIVDGNSYHPDLWRNFPYSNGATTFQGDLTAVRLNRHLDGTPEIKLNFKKLAQGRVDLVISDRIVGTYTAKLLGLDNQITCYEQVLFSKGYPMPFAKKSDYPGLEEIAARFERELRAFKQSDEYRNIIDSWLHSPKN